MALKGLRFLSNSVTTISRHYNKEFIHNNLFRDLFSKQTGSNLLRAFFNNKAASTQEVVADNEAEEEQITSEVISKVNSQITSKSHGRLFAIVQIMGKQFKITPEDVIVIEGFWPPNVSDAIRLEKVMLVGSSDFTVVGRPLLRPDLVNIVATVVEKRLSHTRTIFLFKKRKNYRRTHFQRSEQTMLRINSIEFAGFLDEMKSVEGLDRRIF